LALKILPKKWQIFWKIVIYGNVCQIWRHLATLRISTIELSNYVVTMERFIEAEILVASLQRLNTVAVCLTSCWFGIPLHIQHITQCEVSARLSNVRACVHKYYTSGNIQTAWRLVAFSALSSSLCKAFRNTKANEGGGTSSRCLPCRFITAALSDQPLNGHIAAYSIC